MKLKTPTEIFIMREGGEILSRILRAVSEHVAPGMRTSELDALAAKLIEESGDTAAFLGYKPSFSHKAYPASLCVSVNDEVVHGIPSDRVLNEGDIVGLDLGLKHKNLFVDMAVTVPVGKISEEDQNLIATTKKALNAAIAVVKGGCKLDDIGKAIEGVVLPKGFSIVTGLGGHGVGHEIHEPPFIPHSRIGSTTVLKNGQTIAIEPMINAGTPDVTFDQTDGYTVRTKDGKKSAHFEATLAITPHGADILTPIF